MNFIIRSRGGGKTTEAIAWAKENDATVVCLNEPMSARYRREGLEVTTYDRIRQQSMRGRLLSALVLEDLDVELMHMLRVQCDPSHVTVTASGLAVPKP